MTTIEQARRRYVRYANYEQYRRTSCYGCPHTGATTALAKRLDAASVALDMAQAAASDCRRELRAAHYVPGVEDAACDYMAWAPEHCEFPETVHMRDEDCEFAARMIEAASVRLDVAQSVGRRWSAPLWLEEVAA